MARYAAQLPEFDDGILGLAEEAVARIAELEAEREEVAKELRRHAEHVLVCEMPRTAKELDALADEIERGEWPRSDDE